MLAIALGSHGKHASLGQGSAASRACFPTSIAIRNSPARSDHICFRARPHVDGGPTTEDWTGSRNDDPGRRRDLLFIRFVIAEIFRRYTVHRGMWHSIPAALLVGMFAFLCCASEDISIRLFKTIAVVVGFMSHLLLDEIWSIEFKGEPTASRHRSAPALKFWGDDRVANFVTYTKVFILGFLVYNDEGFMQKFGYQNPEAPHTARQLVEICCSINLKVGSIASSQSAAASLPQRTCENIRPTPRRFFAKYPTLAFSTTHLAEKKILLRKPSLKPPC